MVVRKASSKGIHTTKGLLLKGTLPDGIDSRQVDESFRVPFGSGSAGSGPKAG
jgi:hypothetical protein